MKSKGFTLIEIVITAAVIGLIAGIGIPTYKHVVDTTNTNGCLKNRRTLSEAESLFVLGEGHHSSAMQELSDSEYLKEVPACPAGYAYTWAEYEPDNPNYKSIPVCPLHNPSDILSAYGNIIRSTRYLDIYDSGALLSKISDLSYIPDYDTNSVFATLACGIEIQTDGLGGATVTFEDGTQKTIDDIFNSWNFLKNDYDWSDDGLSYSSDYMYVGYGYAYEGNYDADYSKYDVDYNAETRAYTFDIEGEYSSTYSGASLDTDYGYISEGSYTSNEPYRYLYTYDYEDDGSYSGEYTYSNNYTDRYNYGYDRPETDTQYTYAYDGTYDYSYDGEYSYDASSNTYQSSSSGAYSYAYDYDFGDGLEYDYTTRYTYTSDYTYNYTTRAYNSTYSYSYENGTSYTYTYSYNPSTGKYSYTYTRVS